MPNKQPEFTLPPGHGYTPEQVEYLRGQWEEHQLKHAEEEQRSHAVVGFIRGLDEDQLAALRDLIQSARHSGKGFLAYHLGLIESLLHERHGVCSLDDTNHERELLDTPVES